jgi:hypothetical protein
MKSLYVDLRTDFGSKRLISKDDNALLFINAILKSEEEVFRIEQARVLDDRAASGPNSPIVPEEAVRCDLTTQLFQTDQSQRSSFNSTEELKVWGKIE